MWTSLVYGCNGSELKLRTEQISVFIDSSNGLFENGRSIQQDNNSLSFFRRARQTKCYKNAWEHLQQLSALRIVSITVLSSISASYESRMLDSKVFFLFICTLFFFMYLHSSHVSSTYTTLSSVLASGTCGQRSSVSVSRVLLVTDLPFYVQATSRASESSSNDFVPLSLRDS